MATGESKKQWASGDMSTFSSHASLDISLSYKGKKSIKTILATPPATTSPLWQPETTVTNINQLYYGENLNILAALLQNPDIRGNVQLIYIDPPFATNKVFKSRSQEDAYTDLLTGPQYLEFMRERLILLRELLADNGSIYVHLDGIMAFNVKVCLDEIFGMQNCQAIITRKKCNPKNYTRKTYGNISDYILFYSKSDNYIWQRPYKAWTPERATKEYPYIEEETGRRYKKVPIHAPGVRNGATGEPWRGMMPPPGKHWQYTPETLEIMDKRGEIYWSPNGNPRRKIYLDQSEGIPIQDIWLDVKDAHNQNIRITGYPTEKPEGLLRRIIEASSNPGDLILDCFAGSGTTLAVASELERSWIGIDNSPEAIKTIVNRFEMGLKPMGDYVQKGQQTEQLKLFKDEITPTHDFALIVTEKYQQELAELVLNRQTT